MVIDRTLNAKNAIIILLGYIIAQLFAFFLIGFISKIIASGQGIYNENQINAVSSTIGPVAIVFSFVLGGVAMLVLAKVLVPSSLGVVDKNGAAWVIGSLQNNIKALTVGLLVGVCNQVILISIQNYSVRQTNDVLHLMAYTPGVGQILYVVVVLLLAPLIEEMLFRGLFYGGLHKSFGPINAALLTTLITVLLHIHYIRINAPNAIGIIAISLATLWCRLHWNAIGPAIAGHIGYNLIFVILKVIRPNY